MTRIAAAARPAVREEEVSAEAFDAWAFDPRYDLQIGLDSKPLPACAFLPYDQHTPEMHEFWDLTGPWMECVGCSKLERWED